MRRLLMLAAAVLCVTSTVTGTACTRKSMSAEQIVARYVEARGGLDRIQAIMSLRQVGHLDAGAHRTAMVTRELKRPARSRVLFTVQGVTSVYVHNGHEGWRLSPFEGDVEPQPLPDEAVAEAIEQADIEGPLVDWKAKGHHVELAGKEPVDGRDAWKVKLTLESGAVRYEYFDTTTFERLRSDGTRLVRGRPVQIQTTFGDYAREGGVLFPHKILVTAVGRPRRVTITVDKVEVNPPLSDTLFEKPAESVPEESTP